MAVDTLARALIAKLLAGGGGGGAGGDITSITVNGETIPIVAGNVEIDVPTMTSELENDSNFQTASEVQDTVTQNLSDYVPKTEYDALAAQVEEIKNLLSQADSSIFMVKDTEEQTNE